MIHGIFLSLFINFIFLLIIMLTLQTSSYARFSSIFTHDILRLWINSRVEKSAREMFDVLCAQSNNSLLIGIEYSSFARRISEILSECLRHLGLYVINEHFNVLFLAEHDVL